MATNKDFDCIDFKRTAQEKIYGQIKGMSAAEEIAWFRRKVAQGPFGLWKERLSSRKAESSGPVHCNEPDEDYNGRKRDPV